MEIIKGQNYSLNDEIIFDNKHFIDCNFCQEELFTILNITNCKLEKCNLTNCILDTSNTIVDCNNIQRITTEYIENDIRISRTRVYDKDTQVLLYTITENIIEE